MPALPRPRIFLAWSRTALAPAGTLTLKLALVTGNTAGVDGGGLYTSPGSPVSLKASLIIKNVPDNCVPLGTISGCVR